MISFQDLQRLFLRLVYIFAHFCHSFQLQTMYTVLWHMCHEQPVISGAVDTVNDAVDESAECL